MADNVIVTGLNEFIQSLSDIMRNSQNTIGESFNTSHEKVMEVAKERTPVDTGALQESGIVRSPEIEGDNIKSVGAFGGGEIDYAFEVHENLAVHHTVGQAKYYESAVEEQKDQVLEQLNNDFFSLLSKSISSRKATGG